MRNLTRPVLLSGLSAGIVLFAAATAAGQPPREPLPLDVATSIRSHNGRSPVDLSPDGEWLAHTFGRHETVPRQTRWFAPTGFPFAEGNARMQAALTNTRTAQVIRLGGDKGASWGAVWSPDGQRVAFYSDDSGEAALWIWDRATGKAERFPGVIARPLFGFELVRWSADSQRLLCKILPVGMTVAQANALVPDAAAPRRFSETAPDKPSVFVLRANMDEATGAERPAASQNLPSDRSLADLAILDVRTRRVVSRIERVRTTWYAWSPDQKLVAYTDVRGWEANTQQSIYCLVLFDPSTGNRRVVVEQFRSAYGIDLNWAPDSRRIAYVTSGQLGKRELHILDVTSVTPKAITGHDAPSFDTSDGERPPLWSATSEGIYAVGSDGKLWQIEVASGRATVAGDLEGHQLRLLVSQPHRSTVWSTDREQTIWALGRSREGQQAGIYRIDVGTHAVRPAYLERKLHSPFGRERRGSSDPLADADRS